MKAHKMTFLCPKTLALGVALQRKENRNEQRTKAETEKWGDRRISFCELSFLCLKVFCFCALSFSCPKVFAFLCAFIFVSQSLCLFVTFSFFVP